MSLSLTNGGGRRGSDPLVGYARFGFSIPLGDPGAIQGAARACRALGHALTQQSHAIQVAAGVAVEAGEWHGSGSAYSEYSEDVATVFRTDAGQCEAAATALRTLGHELGHAQTVARQALSDCIRMEGEVTRQQELADETDRQVKALTDEANRHGAHPRIAAALMRRVQLLDDQHTAAQTAADSAGHELQEAQLRGQVACDGYERAAEAATSRLNAAANAIRTARQLPGRDPVPRPSTSGRQTPAVSVATDSSRPLSARGTGHVSVG
jgi:hypothetical protein